MRPQRVAITAAVAAVVAMALAPAGPASAASPDRVHVANAQPSLSGARTLGSSDPAQQITVKLYLQQRNSADLEALVRSVSDPSSSSYGRYLTPDTFRARFSPTAATVDTVRSFLSGYGIGVAQIPANRAYVAARGTVAQFQRAFGTSLATVQVGGTKLRAATSAPTLPTALAGDVGAVAGLASVSSLVTAQHEDGPRVTGRTATARSSAASSSAPPPDAFVNATPCSSYFGQKVATSTPPAYGKSQPYAPCGYVPAQLQGAYGVTSAVAGGLDGRGVRVAITDAYAAPTIASDANTYAKLHGQKPFARGQFTQVLPKSFSYGYDDAVNGDTCFEQDWYGEETLDVEAVHAMAPGAHITYVASPSCNNDDLADTINKVVDEHLADIVTNSWGGTDESNGSPQLDRVYEQIFEQAAAQGIGFYFSSGDSGDGSIDNAAGTPTVDAPANSPFVTAVGGTSLAVGKSGARQWETGWSTGRSTLTAGAWTPTPPGDFLYGAGGGTSRVFRQPWYQQGVVPASLSTVYNRRPARVVPDVSAVGDPTTGMLVGQTQTFPDGTVKYSEYRIGGTSLSSPIFAGVMALADQAAGHPHGFANPVLYRAYGSDALYDSTARPGTAAVRVDYINGVDAAGGTRTTLRTIDDQDPAATILRATAGYDDITGIGSPNGLAFISALRH